MDLDSVDWGCYPRKVGVFHSRCLQPNAVKLYTQFLFLYKIALDSLCWLVKQIEKKLKNDKTKIFWEMPVWFTITPENLHQKVHHLRFKSEFHTPKRVLEPMCALGKWKNLGCWFILNFSFLESLERERNPSDWFSANWSLFPKRFKKENSRERRKDFPSHTQTLGSCTLPAHR